MRTLTMLAITVFSISASAATGEKTRCYKQQSKRLPAGIKGEGNLQYTLSTKQRDGSTLALIMERTRSRRHNWVALRARLYRIDATGTTLLRTVKDGVHKCSYDTGGFFIQESFKTSDIDGDGQCEMTFAYQLNCTSDVSGGWIKLLVLEGKDKYILRGTEVLDLRNGTVRARAHTYKPGKVIRRKRTFLAHARRTWKSLKGYKR